MGWEKFCKEQNLLNPHASAGLQKDTNITLGTANFASSKSRLVTAAAHFAYCGMRQKSDSLRSPKSEKVTPAVSRVLADGRLMELLYDSVVKATSFAVWHEGTWRIEQRVVDHRAVFVPFSPENNLIRNEAVLLPSRPEDYGTEQELRSEVQAFIHRYSDLSDAFEKIATHYVMLSWVYDAFNEVPYLRLRGDFGTGKTRTLLTIGSLAYKPFFASGASTVSPLFHTLDAFRGTLILDEADFRYSDERAEIVKILNNGNVRGLPVLRTIMTQKKEFNPQAFQVFGPKIVAARGQYDDRGLESRFLTEEMGSRRMRDDIPINLPNKFKDEALQLRNKLLLYRFHSLRRTRLHEEYKNDLLEPRSNQIALPLLSIIEDPDTRAQLYGVMRQSLLSVAAERYNSPEGHVVESLFALLQVPTGVVIPIARLVEEMSTRFSAEYERPITNRWIGRILRRRLGILVYKSNGRYGVPVTELEKVRMLAGRFGVSQDAVQ